MARPRKPTAALELADAFKKHPDRKAARANEPKPQGKIGKPPKTLTEDAAEIWDEMAVEGFWLTSADRFQLEIAAKHMASFRLGTADSKDVGQLITVLNKLGFGPAERSKINAPGRAEDDEDKPKGFSKFKR